MQTIIQAERARIDFDFLCFKTYMHGGQQLFKRKMDLLNAVAAAPQVQMRSDFWALSSDEKYKEMFKQVKLFVKLCIRVGFRPNMTDLLLMSNISRACNPFLTHYYLFIEAIRNLSTEQQSKYWIKESLALKMLGTYVQTELAHGSDVQSLETTASFDSNTDEIIIHTTTPHATKYWPGQLGKIANAALVMAKLIVGGKDYGQHFFLVPIRSKEDHSLFPGVETGEIGPKHGWPMKDNGYVIFTHYRIPRTNMLMRFQELDSQGNYRKKGNPKIIYIQMLIGRMWIVNGCLNYLGRALTIALRYCAFRSQFNTREDGTQRRVLDYQLVQYRLMPHLASIYAYFFVFKRLTREYEKVNKQVRNNEVGELGQLHSIVCGMKAFASYDTSRGIEECRECCGGHGFLKSAGISHLFEQQNPYITLEGETGVMAQQTARDLLKNYQKALTGKKTSSFTQYLCHSSQLLSAKANFKTPGDITKDKIEEALKVRACYSISKVAEDLLQLQQDGINLGEAWSSNVQSDLIRAARHHCELFSYTSILKQLDLAGRNHEIAQKVRLHLLNLAELYGVKVLVQSHSELYLSGFFEGEEREILKRALKQKIQKGRPVALRMAEVITLHQDFIHTTIGKEKKDPYEALLEDARKNNPLNKQAVHAGFMKHIKPLMRAKL